MTGYAAVLLAGGAARRMGGTDKPARAVGGQPMLHRVLAAVTDASERIVVGPPGSAGPSGSFGPPGSSGPPGISGASGSSDPWPARVRVTREEPPGGGPVAAAAAGLALLPPGTTTVALLAADLPLLTAAAVAELRLALDGSTAGVACYVDDDGRRQQLCGVWRLAALRTALDRLAAERGGTVDGAPVRGLLAGVTVCEVTWSGVGPPPWFDCDTDEDVRRAEEWTR
ncbi:NTP transferase domain-containing protein [Micromonospora sp. WMMD998]|uniref:NTP transferase domain-containing protein n=1 Tax=Micromonospora sp. WMMD998 TaxID=3016092 RepID=UPI002499C95C|nr:NTP transferase domain-containing protein [Micromonospora sp. WMMD998]WFE37538.1 NTP transferase domain-containing protein [Micromonospora sp. WMMD998]